MLDFVQVGSKYFVPEHITALEPSGAYWGSTVVHLIGGGKIEIHKDIADVRDLLSGGTNG